MTMTNYPVRSDYPAMPALEDAQLLLENGVALLRFCRDDVRNALTGTALVDDIIRVCDWANRTPEVGTLVFTGAGKAFSAGGNVKDMSARAGMFGGEGLDIQDAYRRGIQQMSRAVHTLEVPTIAAVNGPAIGAGLDLACMCDIRIGATTASVAESFVNLGLIPGDGGAWFLPRIVGVQRAAEMTFSGRTVDAEEALAIGLFLDLAPPDQLMARVLAMANRFAAKPRQALRLAKRLLQLGQRAPLADFLDHCAGLQALAHHSAAHQTALAAFLARDN
jgi:enoyl-CoA hydratase/carnithine racemase